MTTLQFQSSINDMTGFCTFNVAVNIGNFCRNIYFRWVMWDGNRRRSRIIDFIEVCKTNKCLSFHFQYSLYIQIAMIDMQIDKWVGIGKIDLNEFVLSQNWINYEVFYWKIWISNITKIDRKYWALKSKPYPRLFK